MNAKKTITKTEKLRLLGQLAVSTTLGAGLWFCTAAPIYFL